MKKALTIIISIIAVIAVGIGIYGCTKKDIGNTNNIDVISSIDTAVYNVEDENGGGFEGVTFSFDKPQNVSGYEFACSFNNGNEVERVEDYKTFSADKTSYYFGTQTGPSKIEIRAFNEKNGEKVYSEWATVLDEGTDYETAKIISGQEWQNIIKNSTEFELY